MLVEILSGDSQGRIGKLLEESPLFDTVEIIVGGISCYTKLVYIPPGDWKIP